MFNPSQSMAAINDGGLNYNAIYEEMLLLFRGIEFDAEMRAIDRSEQELIQFESAIETIRTYGLDAGLRSYLDAGDTLSALMPGTFPSTESWAPHAFENMSSSALALTVSGMENLATSIGTDLMSLMSRKFGTMASHAAAELLKHEQYLTAFAAGTKSLKGIPANVLKDMRAIPRAALDDAIKALQDARTLLAKDFRATIKSEQEMASWMDAVNEQAISIAQRCPWVKSVPQFSGTTFLRKGSADALRKGGGAAASTAQQTAQAAAGQAESVGLVMVPVERGTASGASAGLRKASGGASSAPAKAGGEATVTAPAVDPVPAAQSGMAAPGAIQQEATKAAEVTKGWSITGTISGFFSRLYGLVKAVGRRALSIMKAIGKMIYWILNTVTFGGLNWIRNHLTGVAKAAGAKIDAAAPTGAAIAGDSASAAAKATADNVGAAVADTAAKAA